MALTQNALLQRLSANLLGKDMNEGDIDIVQGGIDGAVRDRNPARAQNRKQEIEIDSKMKI